MTLDDLTVAPWRRFQWGGELRSIDGTSATDFTREDVAELVAYGGGGDRWDGDAIGIVRLRDGRFVSWETNYGPTGDGFACDAYGGDADILFAASAKMAARGISEQGRDSLVWLVMP